MKTYQQAWVLGLGVSGLAAAKLLRGEGCAVRLFDAGDSTELLTRAAELETVGVEVRFGDAPLPEGVAEVAIVSPGIPLDHPWLEELRDRGVPLLSELELGWSRRSGKVLAVTGTNGKSTAVEWCRDALEKSGYKTALAGNIGTPVCSVVSDHPNLDWMVLEVSSFHLETVQAFRPDAGLLLNLAPNHLDRHGDMATYTETKARIFARTGPGDICVVPESLLTSVQEASGGQGLWTTFSDRDSADFYWAGSEVCRDGKVEADLQNTLFDNPVLGVNAAGVVALLRHCGVSGETASETARALEPLPHRMNPVDCIAGVQFVNDSKSTNLASVAAALRMVSPPVRLLAGGIVKEKDLDSIKETLAEYARKVYLFGRDGLDMAKAWSDWVECTYCQTLEKALQRAWIEAEPGETLLLSPGCASFDQFRGFSERGERFVSEIRRIAQEDRPHE